MDDRDPIRIFDRNRVRLQRERVAPDFAAHNALHKDVAGQLQERLSDVRRSFHSILDLGAHDGLLARHFVNQPDACVVAADLSEKMSHQSSGLRVVADEEYLPFAPESFDLVVSNLSLHWVNDLPGALVQIRQVLRPEGLFLAAVLGGETLLELRNALLEAELTVTGGVSPRLSPTITLPAASALMQRAGFALPVVDQETVTLTYRDAFALMRDLRGMGETNAHVHRLRHLTRRAVLFEAAHQYESRFARPDGLIPATFDVIFLHGWKN